MIDDNAFRLGDPEVTKIANGFKFNYKWGEAEGIAIEAKNIHKEKSGELKAQLNIGGKQQGKADAFMRQSLILSSMRSKSQLAKELGTWELIKEYPWKYIIEDIAHKTMDLWEEGDPIDEIWSSEERKEARYLIEPILPFNLPTVIFGDKGTGKSLIALLIGIIAELPLRDNKLGLTTLKEPSPALYLDYEFTRDDTQDRLARLIGGLEVGAMPIHYQRCYAPLADSVESLTTKIEKLGIKLLIIDSLALASGGNINEPEPANRYFSALRQLNITSLTLAHTSKNELGKKTIFGSVFFSTNARSIWECKKTQEVGEDELVSGLFHREANTSKLYLPMGFSFTFSDSKIEVKKQNLQDTGLSIVLPLRIQIKSLLDKGSQTVAQIAGELDKPADTIRRTLNRYSTTQTKYSQTFQSLKDGNWGNKYG